MCAAPSTEPLRPNPHARCWRMAAVAVLLLGIFSAGLDYWLVSKSQSSLDALSESSAEKRTLHQMGEIYGKSGYLIDDLEDATGRPAVQASLILVLAGSLAAGCRFFSRLPAPEPLDDFFKPSDEKRKE